MESIVSDLLYSTCFLSHLFINIAYYRAVLRDCNPECMLRIFTALKRVSFSRVSLLCVWSIKRTANHRVILL